MLRTNRTLNLLQSLVHSISLIEFHCPFSTLFSLLLLPSFLPPVTPRDGSPVYSSRTKKNHRCKMASAAVKNNPMKESSNKLTSSTSEKKAKAGGVKFNKTPTKTAKGPGSSSGSHKSSRSGGKKKSSTRSKESGSKRSHGDKGGSVRKSGSNSGSTKRKSGAASSSKKGGKPRSETIKLSCGSDVYYVSSRHFAACSNLIKRELSVNSHARSVDLRQFDKTTVRVLAEYIESKKIKTDISFYSLAELLKFSKVFEMDNLRSQLEKFITVIAANDLATLHQVLLIIGITAVTRPTERIILEKAARSFVELASQNTFQRIPFNIVISLFARCDLNVKNEVQVVDAMLLWLAGQANLPSVVPSLFYLVRHDFIHSIQKAFIIERARALRFPEDVVGLIERCFECGNGTRICVMKEHYEAKFARCGIADASQMDAKNPHMPLSVPREAIFYKPTDAEKAEAEKKEGANRSFHSSEARPYYHHAPPACANKSRKSTRKTKSKSHKGGPKKSKETGTRDSSSHRSKSSEKSGSRKSSRSKKEIKKTPNKPSKSSSSGKKAKTAKAPPPTN